MQNGKFFSIIGIESWLLTIICSGMAPWGGFGLNLLIAITIGPLKIIGQLIQLNFKRIVRKCAEAQPDIKPVEAREGEKLAESKLEAKRPKRMQ